MTDLTFHGNNYSKYLLDSTEMYIIHIVGSLVDTNDWNILFFYTCTCTGNICQIGLKCSDPRVLLDMTEIYRYREIILDMYTLAGNILSDRTKVYFIGSVN